MDTLDREIDSDASVSKRLESDEMVQTRERSSICQNREMGTIKAAKFDTTATGPAQMAGNELAD